MGGQKESSENFETSYSYDISAIYLTFGNFCSHITNWGSLSPSTESLEAPKSQQSHLKYVSAIFLGILVYIWGIRDVGIYGL